jgi:hypothetical protein
MGRSDVDYDCACILSHKLCSVQATQAVVQTHFEEAAAYTQTNQTSLFQVRLHSKSNPTLLPDLHLHCISKQRQESVPVKIH